jgi:hypothetical protein
LGVINFDRRLPKLVWFLFVIIKEHPGRTMHTLTHPSTQTAVNPLTGYFPFSQLPKSIVVNRYLHTTRLLEVQQEHFVFQLTNPFQQLP